VLVADQLNDVEPWSFVAGDGARIDVTAEHIEAARRLLAEGWCQTSRRFRCVARLPPGQTGVEALIDASRRHRSFPLADLERWARGLGERHAGDHYLRCHAEQDGNSRQLDIPTFAAFRKLGGNTYR